MARRPRRSVDASWLDNIAAQTGVDVSAVQAVLERHQVRASPDYARPRRLSLNRIAFAGEKHGGVTEGAFDWAWDDLGKGMYAVVSDGNLKGKSSIFHVVRWLLRGDPPSGLQADVRSWIHTASLRFALDDRAFEVRLDARDGLKGSLVRLEGGEPFEVARYSGEPEFKAVMSSFFMSELALEPIASWREDLGQAETHDWSALSGVLAVGPRFESLLGETVMGGLSTRLLQMYLGLPWVPTLCAAKVAKSKVEREGAERARRRQERAATQMARIKVLDEELAGLKARLAHLPDVSIYRDRHRQIEGLLLEASHRRRTAASRHGELCETLKSLDRAALEDRRRLQAIIDMEEAGKIFRALDPHCCPRCEAVIADERRKREMDTGACAVCGEAVVTGNEASEERGQAEAQAASSRRAFEAHKRAVAAVEEAVARAAEEFAALENERVRLEGTLRAGSARSDLERAVLRCEARLEEARRVPDDERADEDGDIAILIAAVSELDARVKERQESLLKEVSESIKGYAVRFGMTQLTQVNLKGNATLGLVKGGKSTGFSQVTAGEQLRLKIATVLAMLKLGEKEKLGRHPGLLLVDSPGAEELAEVNLEELIGELKTAAEELVHLQIFIAARASEAILTQVEPARLRRAEGSDWVW